MTNTVTPNPEIVNRRTGYIQKFGPRRAFDGAYALEVLSASGCSQDDIEKASYCLMPLFQNDCGELTVSRLIDLLPLFHEQPSKEEMEARNKWPAAN